MRILTRTELAQYSAKDLEALYGWISDQLLNTRYESPEWQACMISLQNIRMELAARIVAPVVPRPCGPGF